MVFGFNQFSNPSYEEIKRWAYSNEDWPDDEWDLFLAWTHEIDLFIELATDHQCPRKSCFRQMLYNTVGATFVDANEDGLNRIAFWVDKGRRVKQGDINAWVYQVDLLLKGEKQYIYEGWRGGLLADYDCS